MDQIDRIKSILKRERAARKAAEAVIEEKSREIYLKNQELIQANESLEQKVLERTQEIESSRKELIVQRDLAEEATRAKSEFLSNMSHEIRTPLNAIIGLAELMVRDEGGPQTLKYAESIKFSADNLIGIVNEILDFSKIEAGKVTFEAIPFSLKRLLQELHTTFQFKASEKKLDFYTQLGSDIPDVILGDRVKLNQMLINLVGNALKFTDEGYVKVLADFQPEGENMGTLTIKVRDTGIGIPADKLGGIFESFKQADNSTQRKFGGTGLGLAITKQLVELQGGTIGVGSEVGKGTTFFFSLPMEIGEVSMLDEGIQAELNADLSQLKVLLVEDNIVNQYLMRQIFKRKEIPVLIASDGVEALQILRKERVDVVLMDLHMPNMDGWEATKAIRSGKSEVLDAEVPIIGLSADAFTETHKMGIDIGMNDFLTKPIDMDLLYQKLAGYLQPAHRLSSSSELTS